MFPVNELDGRDLLVRELQQLRLANQKLQDHVLTKEGEVSVNLRRRGECEPEKPWLYPSFHNISSNSRTFMF